MTTRPVPDRPSASPADGRVPRRTVRWLVLLAALFVAVLGTLAPATAAPATTDRGTTDAGAVRQADEPPRLTVRGTLLNRADNDAPVEGVKFVVTSSTGATYEGETDKDGRYKIEVPASDTGELTITLDEDTLPDGVKLAEGEPTEYKVSKDATTTIVSFSPAVGPDTRQISTKWDQIPQLIYNGLLFGLIIALGSLGLSMVFGTTGLTNFAHGELLTFGAVVTYAFNRMGLPFAVAVLIAVVLGGLFGLVQDKGLWGPLRKRGIGLLALMIVSIGLMFFLRNVFQYVTGGRTLTYDDYVTVRGHRFLGASYTYRDLIVAAVCVLVLVGVTVALSKTRLGRATRAVSDNPALAASSGINVDRVISTVWIIGTALAALSGAFLGFNMGVTFQIGQLILLLLFCAVVVGGLGSVWGAVIGSLIVGLLIELSTLVLPEIALKNAGAFLLLIVILLVRPQGLLGRKERVG
ncbi:MAG TPA: branched-chain amino acid ABC transporter permease [Marmoricola sp.]|jgi:branched-chain amino acid transport system permease protein|nr:branched-chain amino acid ABC transporter permease [Marmoricola sp.]